MEISQVATHLLKFFDFLRFPSEVRLAFGRGDFVPDRFDLDSVVIVIVIAVKAKVYTSFVRHVRAGVRAVVLVLIQL